MQQKRKHQAPPLEASHETRVRTLDPCVEIVAGTERDADGNPAPYILVGIKGRVAEVLAEYAEALNGLGKLSGAPSVSIEDCCRDIILAPLADSIRACIQHTRAVTKEIASHA